MSDPLTAYFGDPKFRKEWEFQVPPPVGDLCQLCQESIGPDDTGTINQTGQVIHYECQMRSVIGSVGHLLRRCSCFGGTEEDPPGMTRRQAAQAALHLWNERQ